MAPVARLFRRIVSALKLLLLPGDHMPVTRHELRELRHEMLLWETTMSDALDKLGAWAARQAKRDKKDLEAALAGRDDGPPPVSAADRKRALSRKVVASSGIIPMPRGAPHPPDDGDDEP